MVEYINIVIAVISVASARKNTLRPSRKRQNNETIWGHAPRSLPRQMAYRGQKRSIEREREKKESESGGGSCIYGGARKITADYQVLNFSKRAQAAPCVHHLLERSFFLVKGNRPRRWSRHIHPPNGQRLLQVARTIRDAKQLQDIRIAQSLTI